jgi:hypothetical protein
MATWWVDPAAGADTNTGASFAQAVEHIDALLTFPYTKGVNTGDTVNCVNSGNHTFGSGTYMAQLISRFNGTSHAAPGLIIQGTDSSGNAAFATWVFTDDTSGETMVRVDGAGGVDPAYITIQGIKVDWTAGTASPAHAKVFLTRNSLWDTNLRVRYCQFINDNLFEGQIINDSSSLVADGGSFGELAYCYIEDSGSTGGTGNLISVHHRAQHSCHHNVFYFNGAWSQAKIIYSLGNNDSTVTDHRFYNNTVIITDNVSAVSAIWNSFDASVAAAGATKQIYSNVLYVLVTAGKTWRWVAGSATETSANYSLLVGYNLFYYPNSPTINAAGFYQTPYDPDDDDSPEGTDFWATDQAVTAGTDPFNAIGTPFAWDFEGSNYSVTLAFDPRIVASGTYRTMSYTGGVPGAVSESPAAAPVPEINVTPATLSMSAALDDVISATFEIQSLGTGPLTVSSVTSNNSQFTVDYVGGTIGAGATVTVTVTFTPTAAGTQTGTITILSNDSDEPSLTVVCTGKGSAAPPVYIPSPGYLPSQAVTPASPAFFFDDLGDPSAGVRAQIRLKKNTSLEVFMQAVAEADTVSFVASGEITIATNTAMTAVPGLSLAGLTTLILTTDKTLQFEVDNQAFTLLDGGCFVIGRVDGIDSLEVANASLVNPVKVTFFGAK